MHDRMFHVLVLGGISLVACGGTTEAGKAAAVGDAEPSDALAEDGSFPSETNAASPDASTGPVVVFPMETATPYDGSSPSELPPPPPVLDAEAPEDSAADSGVYADAATDARYIMPIEAPK